MSSTFDKLLKRVTAKTTAKRNTFDKINKTIREGKNSPIASHRKMVEIWNSWNQKQKQKAIYKFKSDAINNKTLAEYFAYINRNVHRITTKMIKGIPLSTLDMKFYLQYLEFFLFEENYYSVVNSSWIKSATYQKSTKIMRVTMIRGKLDYPFYNVPIHIWVHLTTLPSHAGTYWWDKWLWQYSTNKRWKR